MDKPLGQDEIDDLLDQCQSAIDGGDWLQALALADAALESQPLNRLARHLANVATENRLEALLDEAAEAAERDDWVTVSDRAAESLKLDPGNDEAIDYVREAGSHIRPQLLASVPPPPGGHPVFVQRPPTPRWLDFGVGAGIGCVIGFLILASLPYLFILFLALATRE